MEVKSGPTLTGLVRTPEEKLSTPSLSASLISPQYSVKTPELGS